MTSEDLPPEIGAVLAAALRARPNRPLQPPPIENEAAAFARAVADVQLTLGMLTDADWGRPSVNGLSVGELVGHLIGTQLHMAAQLGLGGQATPSNDHIESTRDAISVGAACSPRDAALEFARASTVLTDHLSQLDAAGLAVESRFGEITAEISFLLVVRVFELWTHDNDLRRAMGLGRVEPDADRLWVMTRTVMPVVDRLGGDRLRIVLTGAGGGVWPASGEELAEVAVDSIAFCRRVANRMPLDDLFAEISGDMTAANYTLEALAGLALD